jgi:predicted metal-dependent hydrolase
MVTRRIKLDNQEIAFRVERSKRRKTIGLKIGDEGLTITLPNHVGLHHADRAVREKCDWVLDRLEQACLRQRPKLLGVSGEEIGWLGQTLELIVTSHDRVRPRVERQSSSIVVMIDERLGDALAQDAVRRALHRWRKEEALNLMAPKIVAYAAQLGVTPPKVFVREQKARWGSCSLDGSIRMNARLIAFEERIIDFVCAHEVCHLKVMDHSPKFYALFDGLMPDHRIRAADLKAAVAAGAAF